MEINNIKIVPPEGMEAYKDGNEIKFRSISKNATCLSRIYLELFNKKDVWRIGFHDTKRYPKDTDWNYFGNCTSKKQAERLLAINKLMNVAKYLNAGWNPIWKDNSSYKYYINYIPYRGGINIAYSTVTTGDIVYFKTEELAKQAIEILGEETLKLIFSTDW